MQQIKLEKERKKAASERSEAAAERRELERERWELKREREQGYAEGLAEGREKVLREWQEVRSLQGRYDHAIREAEQAKPDWSSSEIMGAIQRTMPQATYSFMRRRNLQAEFKQHMTLELGANWERDWTKRENSYGVKMDQVRRLRECVMSEANELEARQRDEGFSL